MSKIVFVFPGQGSQSPGMGKDLFENSEFAKETYKKADEIMETDISEISFNGPGDLLKQTNLTQPALFIHSYILFNLLKDKLSADFSAGHSLGEYTALCYSGAFNFENGLKLVKARGKLMKDAGDIQKGTMAALIGLDEEKVFEICEIAKENQIVQPANFNCPGQIVISGDEDAVLRAIKIAKEAPFNCRLAKQLEVSGAFHSELMRTLADDFKMEIEKSEISDSKIPVYSNVEAEPVTDKFLIEQLLHRQLYSSVKWEQLIRNMIRDGADTFYEIGNGKVLTGLIKKINPDVKTFNISNYEDIQKI
ncbi:MAG: ACP S-malonyltransferase [Ignavibacteria bacterium]|nr:ACP S-malonyltransferase [Ignavibacteria bacterium]